MPATFSAKAPTGHVVILKGAKSANQRFQKFVINYERTGRREVRQQAK
jgi:hypothetical protein